MTEFYDGVWAVRWQKSMYCQRPECIEIHNCAHRINGYHCASMRTPQQIEQNINDPVKHNPTLVLSEARESVTEHTVAWFYGEQDGH